MIKLFKITALIATMALTCAFFGCSNGNSSDENNSNSSGTTTSSFDDCTTATTEVILGNRQSKPKFTQRKSIQLQDAFFV